MSVQPSENRYPAPGNRLMKTGIDNLKAFRAADRFVQDVFWLTRQVNRNVSPERTARLRTSSETVRDRVALAWHNRNNVAVFKRHLNKALRFCDETSLKLSELFASAAFVAYVKPHYQAKVTELRQLIRRFCDQPPLHKTSLVS